jgi:hypothetical protein
MRFALTRLAIALLGVPLLFLLVPPAAGGLARAQEKPRQDSNFGQAHPQMGNHLTVTVTGGEKDLPVANASVYVKFTEGGKLKDKKYELDVKTNPDGMARVPDAPVGRVLIQVVAEGWKTFGQWYELTEPNQTIKIHLEKPHRWY